MVCIPVSLVTGSWRPLGSGALSGRGMAVTGAVKAWIVVLVVGLGGLGYWNYELYQANVRQAAELGELQGQARAVEQVRADILAEVERALGDSAGQLLVAAQQVEGRISSLEGDVEDMQGPYWNGLGRDLSDLDDELDDVWAQIDRLNQCMTSVRNVLQGFGQYVFC